MKKIPILFLLIINLFTKAQTYCNPNTNNCTECSLTGSNDLGNLPSGFPNEEYEKNEMIVFLNKDNGALSDYNQSIGDLENGRFGIEEIDIEKNDYGLTKIVSLDPTDENNNVFLLVFDNYKDLSCIYNAYSNLKVGNYNAFSSVEPNYTLEDDGLKVENYSNINSTSKKPKYLTHESKSLDIPDDFFETSSATSFSNQWQHQPSFYNSLDSQRTWTISIGDMLSTSSNIAVFDTGFLYKLSSLEGRISRITKSNFNDSELLFADKVVEYSHGDRVSTTLAGNQENSDESDFESVLVGINPNSNIYAFVWKKANMFDRLRFLTMIFNYNIPVRSINMSNSLSKLSYFESDKKLIAINHLENVFKAVLGNGIIIVNASGNKNKYLPSFDPLNNILSSSEKNFISVGSYNVEGERSSFSNYGPNLSVLAPGENILAPYKSSISDNILSHQTATLNGTSHSAPIVSGITSLILSLESERSADHPNFRENYPPGLVKHLIQSTAEKNVGFEGIVESGEAGAKVLKYTQERNDYYGYGTVNAHQALLMTQSYVNNNSSFIYTPDRSEGMHIREMGYYQMLFTDDDPNNPTRGLSINRHKIAGYKLPTLDGSQTGTLWYDSKPDGVDQNNYSTNYYVKSITLEGNSLKAKTFNDNIQWEVELPEDSEGRRLNSDWCANHKVLCYLNPDVAQDNNDWGGAQIQQVANQNPGGANDDDYVIFCTKKNLEEIDSKIGLNPGLFKAKSQWFELFDITDFSEKTIEDGELIVKRSYQDGKEVIIYNVLDEPISTAELYNKIDPLAGIQECKYNRNITDYQISDNGVVISLGNNGHRRLLLHNNGLLGILHWNLQDQENENDDTLDHIKTIFDHEDKGYQSHRLLLRENGKLEFIGGIEDVNGENFEEQMLLESHGGCHNPGIEDYTTEAIIGISDDTNQDDAIEDSYIGVFKKSNNELIFKIDSNTKKTLCKAPTNIKSKLSTFENLVNFDQVPGENKFNYLISENSTKITLKKGDKLETYEIVNGFYSPELPLQSFNL